MTLSSTACRMVSDRHEERRNRILDAAAQTFSAQGFRGARISQIAAQTGMSAGNLYNFFGSKEAIVEALIAREMASHTRVLEELRSHPDPVASLLEYIVRSLYDPQQQEKSVLWIEMQTESLRNPDLTQRLRCWRQQFFALLRPVLHQRFAIAGEVVSDDDLDGRLILLCALIEGLRTQHLVASDENWVALKPRLIQTMSALLLPEQQNPSATPTLAGSSTPNGNS